MVGRWNRRNRERKRGRVDEEGRERGVLRNIQNSWIDKIKRCSLQKQTNCIVPWPCQNVFLLLQIKAH